MKIVLIVLFCFGIHFFASNSLNAESTLNEQQTLMPLTKEKVMAFVNSCDDAMISGDADKDKLVSGFYRLFAFRVKKWLEKSKTHIWEPELPTRIAWSWYVSLYKTFVRMAKIKRNLEQMELQQRDKTDAYKFERKKFMAEYKNFKALQAKPTKLSKSRYRELKRAKAEWEAKEAAKAKALARAKKRR